MKKILALLIGALILSASPANATRFVGWQYDTIVKVRGTQSTGFAVTYAYGHTIGMPSLRRSLSQCDGRRYEAMRCRVATRAEYEKFSAVKQSLRFRRTGVVTYPANTYALMVGTKSRGFTYAHPGGPRLFSGRIAARLDRCEDRDTRFTRARCKARVQGTFEVYSGVMRALRYAAWGENR